MTAQEQFDKITTGEVNNGRPFTVTNETIQDFGDASLDYNPLHFDPNWMEKTTLAARISAVLLCMECRTSL